MSAQLSSLSVRLVFSILFLSFPGLNAADKKREFQFRVLEKPILMSVRATAYTHTERDHLIYGRLSAYGNLLKTGPQYHSAAADWSFLPVGTVFRLKEFGSTYFVVDDYGIALNGRTTVDLYFETPEEMKQWGAREVEIEILRVGDFRASYMILRDRAARFPHCYAMARRIYDLYGQTAENKKSINPK